MWVWVECVSGWVGEWSVYVHVWVGAWIWVGARSTVCVHVGMDNRARELDWKPVCRPIPNVWSVNTAFD